MDITEIIILTIVLAIACSIILPFVTKQFLTLPTNVDLLKCIDYVIDNPGKTIIVKVSLDQKVEARNNILKIGEIEVPFRDVMFENVELAPGVYSLICRSVTICQANHCYVRVEFQVVT